MTLAASNITSKVSLAPDNYFHPPRHLASWSLTSSLFRPASWHKSRRQSCIAAADQSDLGGQASYSAHSFAICSGTLPGGYPNSGGGRSQQLKTAQHRGVLMTK